MPWPTEHVTVLVDGEPCPFVEKVVVTLSAEQAVRSASIELAEPDGRFWFPPGASAVILASGEPILTGHVRDYDAEFDKEDREVRVSLESKTCDLAECGTLHKTGRVRKKTLDKAASELAEGFGSRIRREGEGSGEIVPEVAYHPGETVFDTIERYARSEGLYLTDDTKGDLVMFKGLRGRHAGALVAPGNVIRAGASLSERARKSERRVRGQSSKGWDKKALRQEARIRDAGVKRHRPQIVVHEGEADGRRLKARAAYDQQRAAGFSIRATVLVPSWRDEAGRFWTPAFVIPFDAWAKLRIAQDMAISSGRLEWSKTGGTRATLELRDPAAFADKGQGAKGSKAAGGKAAKSASGTGQGAPRADPVWDMPEDEATLTVDE